MKLDNERYKRMFTRYNAALAEACEQIIRDLPTWDSRYADALEASLPVVAHNAVQDWFDRQESGQPNGGLDTGSQVCGSWDITGLDADGQDNGGSLIDQIGEAAAALELAVHAAALCDDGLPDRVKIKLASFLPQIADDLARLILAGDWSAPAASADGTEQQVLAVLIRLLSDWQDPAGLDPLLARMAAEAVPDERIAEALRDYLVALGDIAVEPLIRVLGQLTANGSGLAGSGDYLLIALTDLGKEKRREPIYQCLKSCFQVMEHRAIGAICLGDYGDGRAVVFLRGWLTKQSVKPDRQVAQEVRSAIQRLGGSVDDLAI